MPPFITNPSHRALRITIPAELPSPGRSNLQASLPKSTAANSVITPHARNVYETNDQHIFIRHVVGPHSSRTTALQTSRSYNTDAESTSPTSPSIHSSPTNSDNSDESTPLLPHRHQPRSNGINITIYSSATPCMRFEAHPPREVRPNCYSKFEGKWDGFMETFCGCCRVRRERSGIARVGGNGGEWEWDGDEDEDAVEIDDGGDGNVESA
ncbi:hypothetical protein K458DRAFT_399990 [Lentithecium fluviatile CBS 122367]|uniref:Uncharacterized protein n=1 Tax=Lentithecium fluviatile CBS 122367 TaxID=1168545 RepID=A0A6G1JF33_9PLEO|nr:hypothetical protein K458DRAFT_399990 [Lentithecium fluviatile CBS 122367]